MVQHPGTNRNTHIYLQGASHVATPLQAGHIKDTLVLNVKVSTVDYS